MSFQQQAINLIRASGGRITPQRTLLLDLLASQAGDMDADQLHQLATAQDPNISLPTIYRTLHTLEAAQIITSHYVSSDHERKVYRIHNHEDAFHFTCRRCGQVITFHSDLIDQLRQDLSTQLDVDELTLCLCAGGLCADCRKEKPTMTLDRLQSGQFATIRRITGTGLVRRRLMDMGLVRGISIEMVRAAPMGDPVEYLVRGYHLSLRKSEAALVEIELSEQGSSQ